MCNEYDLWPRFWTRAVSVGLDQETCSVIFGYEECPICATAPIHRCMHRWKELHQMIYDTVHHQFSWKCGEGQLCNAWLATVIGFLNFDKCSLTARRPFSLIKIDINFEQHTNCCIKYESHCNQEWCNDTRLFVDWQTFCLLCSLVLLMALQPVLFRK